MEKINANRECDKKTETNAKQTEKLKLRKSEKNTI